jgi:hypothetical protein
MTLEQLAVILLTVGVVGLSYHLLRRVQGRGRRMRHAAGAEPLPVADLAASTLLVPAGEVPPPDLWQAARPAAAQLFPLDVFPLDALPSGAGPAVPDRVVQLPPDPGPAEPMAQHAWMGPDGLVIPMPGRDPLKPTGRL